MTANIKRFVRKFIFGILILCTFSCTSYVSISTTAIPEIILPGDSADFLLINRFVPDDLDYKNENKVDVYIMGIEKYIEGLKAGFDMNRKINLIIADTTLTSHSAHEPAYNLSTGIIQELCREYDPDYILSLDNYDLVLNTYITIYSINGMVLDKLKEALRTHHDSRAVASGLLAVGPSMGHMPITATCRGQAIPCSILTWILFFNTPIRRINS